MITSIKKIKSGIYLLNDCVKVSNFNAIEEENESGNLELNVYCNIDFTEEITEQEANDLVSEFINNALREGIRDDNVSK